MKILIIGGGGIGSVFLQEFAECMNKEQMSPDTNVSLADDDIVELNQLKYQNFLKEEIGQNKAISLCKRIKVFNTPFFKAIPKRILKESQLVDFDFFILCVDNDKVRQLVINYCFNNDKEFIDLRATGRIIAAFPKLINKKDNLAFVDLTDTNNYSCQDKGTLNKGHIDIGHKVVAYCGVQMYLNYTRNLKNKPMTWRI